MWQSLWSSEVTPRWWGEVGSGGVGVKGDSVGQEQPLLPLLSSSAVDHGQH